MKMVITLSQEENKMVSQSQCYIDMITMWWQCDEDVMTMWWGCDDNVMRRHELWIEGKRHNVQFSAWGEHVLKSCSTMPMMMMMVMMVMMVMITICKDKAGLSTPSCPFLTGLSITEIRNVGPSDPCYNLAFFIIISGMGIIIRIGVIITITIIITVNYKLKKCGSKCPDLNFLSISMHFFEIEPSSTFVFSFFFAWLDLKCHPQPESPTCITLTWSRQGEMPTNALDGDTWYTSARTPTNIALEVDREGGCVC